MTVNEQPLIFIVEDDERLAHMIADFLRDHGFRTAMEDNGERAIARIINEAPDLVILDVMLPSADGFTVCRRVRFGRFERPILMLTARSEDIDEVESLEDGADDYVRKPVRPRVLLARIRALLRRRHSNAGAPAGSAIRLGRLEVDPGSRSASLNARDLVLTGAEFDLLLYLARHAGVSVSRESIYKDLRGIEYDGFDRSIDLRISRLRKKLGDTGPTPSIIKSVRGVGYLLVETV
ncbi:MAG: response regulator transcription factor [Myxococcota bacterium]